MLRWLSRILGLDIRVTSDSRVRMYDGFLRATIRDNVNGV
jgi:hypothetical protein